MQKSLLYILLVLAILYLFICLLAYFNQEKGIFHPDKLERDFNYNFIDPFEEVFIPTREGLMLNALHFSDTSNDKVVVYYHGNAGTLEHWGEIAHVYMENGFNLIIYDYRGFGKSEGRIESEEQFYSDAKEVYQYTMSAYDEEYITVVGYSIGTAPASYVASVNNPERLILKSPYYDLPTLALEKLSWLPLRLLLKYEFSNRNNLEEIGVPVHIFHGGTDQLITTEHSKKLVSELDMDPELILLPYQGHHGMNFNEIYIEYLGVFSAE